MSRFLGGSERLLGSGRVWIWFWSAWTAFAVLTAAHIYVARNSERALQFLGRPTPLPRAALDAALYVYPWALMTLAALWLSSVYPPGRARWLKIGCAYFLVATVLILAREAVIFRLRAGDGLDRSPSFADHLLLFSDLPLRFLYAFMVLGWGFAIDYTRRLRDRELLQAELALQLGTVQLQMLKMQLHPHFLFNTLNTVSSLIPRDPKAADRVLARLGELLRGALSTAQQQEVTLAEELRFLEPYIEIERIRMGERLGVRMEIAPGTERAVVPHLLLQPLVENAIQHGIGPRVDGGTLRVSVTRCDDLLKIVIVNEYTRLRPGRTGSGIGLTNTRKRLEKLYGSRARLLVVKREDEFSVVVEFPFRSADQLEMPPTVLPV